MDDSGDIWGMTDADLHRVAQSKLRTVTGRGKADIGGRMRIASILRKIGAPAATAERIAGSTNEVWRSGDFIIRVGTAGGTTRLRREARLIERLPWGSAYPDVVAAGEEPFGEWMVLKHRKGVVLSDAWVTMDRATRRRITHDLAVMTRDVHGTQLSGDFDFDPTSTAQIPYELRGTELIGMLERFALLQDVDQRLVEDLIDRVTSLAGAFDDRSGDVLLHGDLHFENVLVERGEISCVLDFEWARTGPVELDIDVLARFCLHPDLTVGAATKSQRDGYRPVLGWFNEAYPEMFSAADLSDRLTLASLGAEIPWLLRQPPTADASQLSPFHPVNRIREMLTLGSAAHRLGWLSSGI